MMHRRLLLALACLLLAACGQHPPPLRPGSELIVLTKRSAPLTTPDESIGLQAFERELTQQFASDLGHRVRFVTVDSDEEIFKRLQAGEAHLAAAWLTPPEGSAVRAITPFARSRDALVQHEDAIPFDELSELAGREVHVVTIARHASAVQALQKLVPELKVVEHPTWGETELIEQVAARKIELALSDAMLVTIAGNFHPELEVLLELGNTRPIAWLFPPQSDPELLGRADDFIAASIHDGSLARLKDRFFGHIQRLQRNDVVQFIERVRSVLPNFMLDFKLAQVATGIDWRLLAALAYQESQWDPLATSPTGVRGMMMLTEDTADRLNVRNRLDPRQSISAGARYLSDLMAQLPITVRSPDRLWLALAAYNLGQGHLNGARAIAQGMKVDADSWFDMKRVLPLMARPEYYSRLKSGRARGGEAVIMVENIRMFYDILSRYEAAYEPLPVERLKGGGLSAGGGVGLKTPGGSRMVAGAVRPHKGAKLAAKQSKAKAGDKKRR